MWRLLRPKILKVMPSFLDFSFNYGQKSQLVTIWSTKFSVSLAFEVKPFYDVQVELALSRLPLDIKGKKLCRFQIVQFVKSIRLKMIFELK